MSKIEIVDGDPILTSEAKLVAEDTDGGRSLSDILFCGWYTSVHKFSVLLNLILLLSFLFAEEYTQDNDSRKMAESIIFWCGLMGPQLLLFIPIKISFYTSFPRKIRFRLLRYKPYLIEMIMLLGLVVAIPLVLALNNFSAKHLIKEVATVLAIFSSLLSMTTIEDEKQLCIILRHTKESKPLFRVQDILLYIRSKAQDSNLLKRQETEIVEMTNHTCNKCQSCHTNFCCCDTFECIAKLPSVEEQESMKLDPKNFEVRMDDSIEKELYDLVDQHLSASSMLGNSSTVAVSMMLKLLWKFPSKLVIFAITSISNQIAIALLPYSTALVVDAISKFDPFADSQREIFIPAAILLGNFLLIPIFDSSSLLTGVQLGANVQRELKNNLFQVVLGIQTRTQNKKIGLELSPGDLSSRFANDFAIVGDFISGTLYYDFSAGVVRTIVSLIILGLFDARTAVFFAICIPVLISVQGDDGRSKSSNSKASGNVQGAFQNLVKIRRTNALYDSGGFVWNTVSPRIDQDYQALDEGAVSQAVFAASVNGYTNLYIGMISFAFILSIVQSAEDGDDDLVLAASLGLGLIGTIFSPIKALARTGQKWLQCIPALHRIRETDNMSATTEPSRINGTEQTDKEVPLLNESLILEDVRFRYPTANEETLKGVDLNLKAGEYVCIVGESGAGKSTLLNILTQEEAATKGQLLVDAHPVKNARSYQRQIAVVLQDSNFLEGTIRDNIRMGKPDATEEEIDQAVTKSQCSRFVNDLPNGIDTFLGPNLNVSGGQAQRISLARALVRSPRVLFLDEATSGKTSCASFLYHLNQDCYLTLSTTSALDLSTEREVIDTISHLAQDDNVLVISVTHRLETTDSSNRILVLENGKVAEEGSPNELNQSGTLFERIRNGGESNMG